MVNKDIFFCDYCGKHSFKSLKTHETHCIVNPDRVCQLCGRPSIDGSVEHTNDCPNCILDQFRQWWSRMNDEVDSILMELD